MVTGFRLLLLLAAAAVCCEGWLGGKGVQPKKEDAVGGPRTLETGGNASSEQVDPDLEKKVDSQSSENQTGVDLAVARDRQENGAEQDHRSDDHSAARSNMLASKPISTRGRYKYTHGNISHYISDSVTGYSLRVVTDQLDEHFKTCGDRCMVRGQPREQCPLHGVAPELLTWMTDLKDLLSVGCKLPQDNKGDRCCIANDAAVSGTLRDITLMIRDVYGVLQDSCSKCPVDGDWSEWSPWTQCSVSCDMGTRWQTRTCNNPSPAHGGQACRGAARLEAVCSLPPCCVSSSWNSWSPWSQCSVTCGDGHRRRSRICADVSPNVCATSCQGPKEEMETCNLNEPRDGNWSPWVAWSVCSVTCGCGMRSRSRQCSNPERNECGSDCIGNNLEKELCYGPPCCDPLDGGWSYWSSWSTCSASCGSGERTRSRICSDPVPNKCGRPCPGQSTERERCEGKQCCVPSSWNPWSAWSQCSVTCGDGHRRRSRICADLSPNVCATSCQGPNEVMETCNVNEPRDGNWSPWVAWSVCSVTCGCGMRSRSRQCSNPERNECGSDCIGNNLDKELCYGPPCCEPVDGGWSYWSSWSTCSAGCGPGERTRSRTCSDPEPNKCGLPCPGQPTERERCVGRQCCVDGNWGPWGSPDLCSVTCGTGIQTRSRECDQPPKNDCGRPCPGPKYDIIDCDTRIPCVDPGPPVPCEYEWSNWSQCSVTCGRGIKSRRVQLIDMSLRDVCQNTTMESEICDIGSRDGEWAPWSSWSDCSVRCGSGERRRTRTCTNPRPDSCGQPCPGQDLQRERCEETCCSWSDWSSWSSCNPTCGYAERSRQRFCVSTSRGDRELSCANRCPGSSTDVDSCSFINCEPPPSWSSWEAWCPCDCSTGRSSRRRGCERRYRDGRVVQAGVNLCPGESRQEVYCDVLDTSCPRCVTDCRLRESFGFLENGNYPSCFSCKEYITCTNGVVRYGECPIGREFDAFKRKCVIGSSPSCALVECVRDCSGLDDGNYPSCDLCGAYRQCRNNRLTEILCDGGSEFDMHFEGCRTDNKPSPTCIRSEIGRDVIMLADDPNSDLIEDETIAAQNVTISESGVSGSHKRKHLPRDHETPTDPPVENAADEKILVPVTKLPLSAATKSTNSTNEERNVDAKHRDADDVTTRKRKKPDKKKATSQPKETHKDKKHEKRKMKVREERTNKSLLKVKCYTTCSDPGTFQSCRGCQFYLTCTKHGVAHVRKCPETESWDDLSKKCRLNSSTCSGRVQLVSADGSSSSDPPILDDMS